ncbi:hypothetical protein IC614_01260 [Allosphingosinicella flava]|uniref:Uncharacterized protein n=1 Tax=Allosphingosinicella flava TaxID=2771430 RepID=A0A7T2GJZ8_9SPHN|nr:hypothetical protein [Sphingosinicella flava]QPQ55276.1 hypothetical protein IC614_01260 [Sphingosinicella flava]
MSLTILMILQASAAIGPPGAAGFDLKSVPARRGDCKTAAAGEIVVCGRRAAPDRTHYLSMEAEFRDKPVRAEAGIGGGVSAKVHAEQAEFPNGQVSKRALITLTKPF